MTLLLQLLRLTIVLLLQVPKLESNLRQRLPCLGFERHTLFLRDSETYRQLTYT